MLRRSCVGGEALLGLLGGEGILVTFLAIAQVICCQCPSEENGVVDGLEPPTLASEEGVWSLSNFRCLQALADAAAR